MAMRKFGDAGHRGQTADSAVSAEPVEPATPVVDSEDPQGLSKSALRHLGAAQDLPEETEDGPYTPSNPRYRPLWEGKHEDPEAR